MLEVFKQLIIRGDPRMLSGLVEEIADDPATGWRRNRDREPPRKPKLSASHDITVFRWRGSDLAPPADLYLSWRDGRLEVTNIVPVDVHRLSYAQYNSIISDFVSSNVIPRKDSRRLEIELTPDRLSITHWLTEEAAKRLRSFSRDANRAMLHPFDQERWRAFLIRAHLDRTTLDTETLFRWLTEEERWPDDAADPLILQFEFALQLLDDYDKNPK